MTTVAYRDGAMVADTLMTRNGNELIYGFNKLNLVKEDGEGGPWLVGIAGDPTWYRLYLMWLEDEAKTPLDPLPDDFKEADGTTVLVYAPKFGLVDLDYPAGIIIPSDYYAIGSGSSYAMGAMAMGATALEAVHVAAKYDAFTGGTIMEVRVS